MASNCICSNAMSSWPACSNTVFPRNHTQPQCLTQSGACLPGPYLISFPPCSLCCSHRSFIAVSQVHQALFLPQAHAFSLLGVLSSPRSCLGFLQNFRSLLKISSSSEGPSDSFKELLLCCSVSVLCLHRARFSVYSYFIPLSLFVCCFLH